MFYIVFASLALAACGALTVSSATPTPCSKTGYSVSNGATLTVTCRRDGSIEMSINGDTVRAFAYASVNPVRAGHDTVIKIFAVGQKPDTSVYQIDCEANNYAMDWQATPNGIGAIEKTIRPIDGPQLITISCDPHGYDWTLSMSFYIVVLPTGT